MRLRTLGISMLALSLVACGGSGGGSTTPGGGEPAPPPVPLVSLVNPSAVGIVHLDITALSRSEHYQSFVDLLSLSVEAFGNSSASGLIQALLRSQEFMMFIERDGSGDIVPVMLLRGSFVDGDAQRIYPPELEVREEERGGVRLYHAGHGLVASVGGHTIMVGDGDAVSATVDRQLANGSGSLPSDSAFGTLISSLGIATSNIGYAVALDERMRAELADELDIPPAVLAPFTGMGLQMTLSTGFEVRGTMMSDSSLQAAAFLVIANQVLARIRRDEDVTALGFEGVLGAINLRRDGGNLLLNLSLSSEQVREASRRVEEGLRREVAEDAAAAGASAPPAP
jgi:hypothetical protein